MMSFRASVSRPVSHKRRNLLVIGIAAATLAFLYINFNATPAGGSLEQRVNLDEVTRDISVPTDGNNGSSNASGEGAAHGKNTLHGDTAFLMQVMLLERGIAKLQSHDYYAATFFKREFVNGKLADPQVMQLKIRHKPFSVYMKWLVGDKGRELLYVDGENNGDMLIKLGGKGRLIPTLKLDPAGDRAMSETRWPATNVGMLNLAKKILEYRRSDYQSGHLPKMVMFDDQVFDKRPCFCFVVDFPSPQVSKTYRKTITFIDKEWCVPVCVQNFAWPDGDTEKTGAELDKVTMIEDYRYSNVRFQSKLTAADFSRDNAKYNFR